MKYFAALLLLATSAVSASFAQTGTRILGAQQFVLDDGTFANQRIYQSEVNGSMGIDPSGIVTGSFPSTCALLDLSSISKGFLPPRMTTAQEALICGGTPTEGLVVYNLTTHQLDVYNGSFWGSTGWALNGNNLSGGTPATPVQYFGSNNNFDVVMKTNNIERLRIGSSAAPNVLTETMPATANIGMQINGSSVASRGVRIDMASAPTSTANAAAYEGSVSGTALTNINGMILTVTGNQAGPVGASITSSNLGGIGFAQGAIINTSSTGSGSVRGLTLTASGAANVGGGVDAGVISATNTAGDPVRGFAISATSNTGAATGVSVATNGNGSSISGVFVNVTGGASQTGTVIGAGGTATGGPASNQISGANFSAVGANSQVAVGGAFFANGSTNFNLGVAGNSFGPTAGTNVGLQAFAGTATGANIGVDANAQNANSIGVQIGRFWAPNTAIQSQSGRIIWGNAGPTNVASGGAIPTTAATVVVGDNGVGASVATATLPAGIEGQVIYVTTADPDGVKITVGLASVTISNAEVGRFMYIGGQWRLEH